MWLIDACLSIAVRSSGRSFLASVFVAWLGAALPLQGHNILINSVNVTVDDKSAEVTVTIDGNDLIHSRLISVTQATLPKDVLTAAAHEYAERVLASLELRDPSGRRLNGTLNGVWAAEALDSTMAAESLDEVTFMLRYFYVAAEPLSFLTIRQDPRTPIGPVPVMLSTSVSALTASNSRYAQIGPQGAATTLQLEEPLKVDSATDSPAADSAISRRIDSLRSDRFSTVYAMMRPSSEGVSLELYIPIPLVETWMSIPRAHRDFVRSEELKEIMPAFEKFITSRLAASTGGESIVPTVSRVALLNPSDQRVDGGLSNDAVGAWSGRLGVQLNYSGIEASDAVDVEWRLFNAAVLNATVYVDDPRLPNEQILMPGDAHIRLPASVPPG